MLDLLFVEVSAQQAEFRMRRGLIVLENVRRKRLGLVVDGHGRLGFGAGELADHFAQGQILDRESLPWWRIVPLDLLDHLIEGRPLGAVVLDQVHKGVADCVHVSRRADDLLGRLDLFRVQVSQDGQLHHQEERE